MKKSKITFTLYKKDGSKLKAEANKKYRILDLDFGFTIKIKAYKDQWGDYPELTIPFSKNPTYYRVSVNKKCDHARLEIFTPGLYSGSVGFDIKGK